MKRVVLILLFIFSFSFGNEIVGSGNIFDVIKNIELKESAIITRASDINQTEGIDLATDKILIQMSKEKEVLLKNVLELFKTHKAYASMVKPYDESKSILMDNIKHNKKKGYSLSYTYRDKMFLVSLELENDLILEIETINSFIDLAVSEKVFKSYLEGLISVLRSSDYNDVLSFIEQNKDKKEKKYIDVKLSFDSFVSKRNAHLILYEFLLKNIDIIRDRDIVLDTFKIFSLSEFINDNSKSINLFFEINVLKYFSEIELIINPAKIVLILITLFLGIFVFKFLSYLMEKGFVKIAKIFTSKKTDGIMFSHNLVDSVNKPFMWFYSTIVLFIFFKILFSPNDLPEDIDTLFDLSHLFTFVWVAWRLISNYEDKITEEIKRKKDDITSEAVSFGVLTFKIFLSIIFIGSFITLAIPSIVNYFAGAGFLIAFILKDNVSDYFDAFKIIKEPNVQVGHWILLPLLKGLEGVVHDIGIWNTTIIMFDQSTITIPNSTLVKTIIRNFSRRAVRQIKFNFYLPLTLDSDVILKIVDEINIMLMDHPNLTHKNDVKGKDKDIRERGISGTCFARWVNSENGAKILIYSFTNQDDWMFQLETQENIQAQIKNICRKHDTDMVMKDDFVDIAKLESYKTIMSTMIDKES